jgi:hypothetical protein
VTAANAADRAEAMEAPPAPPAATLAPHVGSPADPLEREADAAAERALGSGGASVPYRAGAPLVQRMCATCAEAEAGELPRPCPECAGSVQRKPLQASRIGPEPPGLGRVLGALEGRGAPMAPAVRADYQRRLGADFSGVRIHTGPDAARAARSLGAIAFTRGRDVVFDDAAYDPVGQRGRKLLAHELAHTVQQGAAPPTA